MYKDRGKANKGAIVSALREYQLVDGAKELVEYLKKQNYEVAIISGSFHILVDEVAMVLGVSFKKGNTMDTLEIPKDVE